MQRRKAVMRGQKTTAVGPARRPSEIFSEALTASCKREKTRCQLHRASGELDK